MNHIVVGVDGSTHADLALAWAVAEAELRPGVIELVHGYVVHPHATMFGRSDRELAEARMDAVIEHNRHLLDRVEWTATVMPVMSSPAAALVEAAEDADLVVVGSRGLGGFAELFLGSTSYRTAANASAPVAVIRGETTAADGIVVGVDGSRGSGRALRWAFDEAERRGVGVTVVHAYHVVSHPAVAAVGSPEQLQALSRRAHDDAMALVDRMLQDETLPAKVDVERVVAAGSPAGLLLDHAGPDQLLVVSTHGRGALGRAVFGSVSHQCLHHASGPVVVVP